VPRWKPRPLNERIPPHIGTVDSATWFAVVLVTYPENDTPVVRCVGFGDRKQRDGWLAWYTASLATLFDAVPARLGF